jgi:WD40 repeat protein
MHFHPSFPSLLLTAGKGGYLAVFNTDTTQKNIVGADEPFEDNEVLIAFRPHNRWVSSAKFVSLANYSTSTTSTDVGNCETMLVLTASDDAEVKLWDLNAVKNSKASKSKVPKLVCSSKSIHSKCIFSMDETGQGRVITGSKDRAVCLSRILPDGSAIKLEREFSLHSSVVKTVCWQPLPWAQNENFSSSGSSCCAFSNPGTIFASGGQDRRVCVKDTRTPSASADISMENVHTGGIHTAVWSPSSGTGATPLPLLLTAAMQDNTIKVFDLRRPDPSVPLFSFRGHTNVPVAKIKSIQPPKFLNPETIIAMGESSSLLSIYCAKTGATISRGSGMEDMPMHIACNHDNASTIAVACRSGSIYNLKVV